MVIKSTDPRKWPKKINKAPIEGLTTEEQFKKISSNPRTKWITDTLDLDKRTNVSIPELPTSNEFSIGFEQYKKHKKDPKKEKQTEVDYNSPYASAYNRSDHIPFSDWSAKTNYEYYGKLMDLEVNWGHPIYHRSPRPFDPPKMKPGLYNPPPFLSKPAGGPWGEIEASSQAYWQEHWKQRKAYDDARRKAYQEALWKSQMTIAEQLSFWGVGAITTDDLFDWGFLKIVRELQEFKDNYWNWSNQKILVAWGNIRHKLDSLNIRQKQTSYYYKMVAELNARLDAVQNAFKAYTLTRDYGWWALIYIIFLFALTISSLSVCERMTSAYYLRPSRLPPPLPASNQVILNLERSDLDPISEMGGYDLPNPPVIEFTEFVYSPPPIRELIVRPDLSPAPIIKPYSPWKDRPNFFAVGREITLDPLFSVSYAYPEVVEPSDRTDLIIRPSRPIPVSGLATTPPTPKPTIDLGIPLPNKELSVWTPQIHWHSYLTSPWNIPEQPPKPEKHKTMFQYYREEITSILTGIFGLTVLPWLGSTPAKPVEFIPVGAEITPFVRRLNDWLGTYYYKDTWEALSPETKADLKNQMNRRVYFLKLVNEILFPITEEEWLSLDLWERQNILDLIGDNL